jgi:DnaJ family protein A protein 2
MSEYYQTLGISKNATEDEIKRAYRKLAMIYHPDRYVNASEDEKTSASKKIVEINKAYETLKDPSIRAKYDAGEMDDNGNPTQNNGNPFGDMFGMFNNFGARTGIKRDLSREKSAPTKMTIELSLADFYTGKTIHHQYTRTINCRTCTGTGVKSVAAAQICGMCGGSGIKTQMRQFAPGYMQQVQFPCDGCNQRGKIITPDNICPTCNYKKVVEETKSIEITVKPGTTPGSHIKFMGAGNIQFGYGYTGDLIVILGETTNTGIMHREGANLVMTKTITLLEALTGYTLVFRHLDNRIIKASTSEIISPTHIMKIAGEGMPKLNETGGPSGDHGDLIIHFIVKFPETLDDERKELIAKILKGVFIPPQKQIWDIDVDSVPPENLYTHTLETITTSGKEHYANMSGNVNPENHHEQFPDEYMPQQGVQCSQQ